MSTRVKYLSCFCCCSVDFGFCFHSTLVSQSCLDNNATCLAFFYFTSRSSLTILDFFLIHYYFSELRHTQPLKRDTQTKNIVRSILNVMLFGVIYIIVLPLPGWFKPDIALFQYFFGLAHWLLFPMLFPSFFSCFLMM